MHPNARCLAPAPASRVPVLHGSLVRFTKRLTALTVMSHVADAVSPLPSKAASKDRPKSRDASPVYPPRVQQVLEYLKSNPIRLQSIPMLYDADVSDAHLPAVVRGLTPEDVMPSTSERRDVNPAAAKHYARVVAALLYTVCGGLDQAHNLVTPLCWGAPTPYGGKPIAGSPAASDAAYVHALVHHREGLCDGEFGTGFSNANYWYAAAGSHPVQPHVLRALQTHAAGDERLERLAAAHGEVYSPAKWVAVCSEAARSGDPGVTQWVERVAAAEFSALLKHCYGRLAAVA